MKLSSVNNFSITKDNKQSSNDKNMKNQSFKGIYIDGATNLGAVKKQNRPAIFLKKDSLMLNEVAQKYPNQDCFIRRGYLGLPRLEYREKPPEVQVFDADVAKRYKIAIDTIDPEYPCMPLIIYPESDLNAIIGVPSFVSTNPSLAYTVRAGFELHKKLLEKKFQIMDIIGSNDSVDFGNETIMEKAHKAVEELEVAITRYLVDCAYAVLKDRPSAKQIYESDYLKIQTVLDSKRKYDLTTSVASQKMVEVDNDNDVDICEYVMKNYPNMQENIDRLKDVRNYMRKNGMTLDRFFDIKV